MKILIDADGCPVVKIVEEVAKAKSIETLIVFNIHHQIYSDYCQLIQVDEGRDVVDFKIVNSMEANDLVITQDYGLAAMVLSRNGYAMNQNGMIYDPSNIEVLLLQRFIAKKEREKGHRVHGAKKRDQKQNQVFKEALELYIEKIERGSQG